MRHGEFLRKHKAALLYLFMDEIVSDYKAGQPISGIAKDYGIDRVTMYRFIKEVV
jgi:DNA invertase Pin-like site-specific DNA recombinase